MSKHMGVALFYRTSHAGEENVEIHHVGSRQAIIDLLGLHPRPQCECCEPAVLTSPYGGRLLAGYNDGRIEVRDTRISALL